jgi:preprotein translocase subunit SecA
MLLLIDKIVDFLLPPVVEFSLKEYKAVLEEINKKELEFKSANDTSLKKKAKQLKENALKNQNLDTLLVETYALVREVSKRKLKMRPFDVQVLAAIAMHKGKLAEMATGEGKTLAAVMPVCLNALTGKGVHVLTFNDYLAQRDAGWMGPVYEFLGLSVGYIRENMDRQARKKAYACDITYATAKEVGFDYLRSFLAYEMEETVLRPFHYAIVDEADSILIDEARVPLVIAGNLVETHIDRYHIAGIISDLKPNLDFRQDDHARNVFLTEQGMRKVESRLSGKNLYAQENEELLSAVLYALHARILLERNIDYIVRDNRIRLIDAFTGRVVEDRRFQEGLQSAVEAKEKVKIETEGVILGSVTMQHFIQQYPKLSGMTATAQQAAKEFIEFYGLKTVVIPPNRKCIRKDYSDRIYTHSAAKVDAIVKEVKHVHKTGRPILIGTFTVEESEKLATLFAHHNIPYQLLNAKNHAKEAAVIANAGALGAVTISTNMAGRGTDILLGGKDGRDKKRVVKLGGLYVIGTNRHESRRIDNQLRGRAGRQGDPGSSRYFISFDDDLMVQYRLKKFLPRNLSAMRQQDDLNSPFVRNAITHVQKIIEGQCFEIRKTLMKYSLFVEKQRLILHKNRQDILFQKRLKRLEKDTRLFFMDYYWSKHLAHIAEIKDTIYLVRFGGHDPLIEFMKTAKDGFTGMQNDIKTNTRRALKRIENLGDNVSLKKEGINKPASTWTYLVDDNPFRKSLGFDLGANANIGYAVGSILAYPVLLLAGIIKLWRDKRNNEGSS